MPSRQPRRAKVSKKIVVTVTGDHILRAALLKRANKNRASSCPLALCLRENGYPKAKVLGGDDGMTLNGVSVRHSKSSLRIVEEFDNWVDVDFSIDTIPKPRTVRISVKEAQAE